MNKIVIIGHGGFGREVKMLIDQINQNTLTYDLLGFYDDNEDSPSIIHGLKYLGKINELSFIKSDLNVVYKKKKNANGGDKVIQRDDKFQGPKTDDAQFEKISKRIV